MKNIIAMLAVAAVLSFAFPVSLFASSGVWEFTGSPVYFWSYPDDGGVVLADGRVLLAGGAGNFGVGAEVYDPSTGMWSAVADMGGGRIGHVVVRLNDGRVLAAGGCQFSYCGYLSSVEVYDLAADTWSTVAPMLSARSGLAATLLADGRVLVVGGTSGGFTDPAAEIYDPNTDTWSATEPMVTNRTGGHTSTLLADGRVLVVGGSDSEVYDPATDAWSAVGSLQIARSFHRAVLLNDNRVLAVGGSGLAASESTEIFDPVANSWELVGNLNVPRTSDHTATLLAGGRVLVAGGKNDTDASLPDAEIFDPAVGTWELTAPVNDDRSNHFAGLLGTGEVLVAGGFGATQSAELFREIDTVAITRAVYRESDGGLMVQATSDDPDAELTLVGYGVMSKRNDKWVYRELGAADPGETVTVTSSGKGSATSSVQRL